MVAMEHNNPGRVHDSVNPEPRKLSGLRFQLIGTTGRDAPSTRQTFSPAMPPGAGRVGQASMRRKEQVRG